MYNDGKGFSLIRIIVKIIIVIIFILLAIWLISKVINKTSNSAMDKNMDIMKNASIEYFKKGNLPEKEGEAKKVTLNDLIKMKYISSFDKNCDRDKSYSQATLVDDYYALRVELLCGNKKKYIYSSIDKNGNCIGEDCKKEDNSKNKKNNDNKNDNSSDNNKDVKIENDSSAKNNKNDDSSKNGKTLYYEFVKVNRIYSDWTYNKLSGSNVESKQQEKVLNKYCRILTSEYYVISYYSANTALGKTYKNVVRLDNIPAKTSYYNLSVSELFDDNVLLYKNLINSSSKVTFISGNNGYNMLNDISFLMLTSLRNSNVTITNNSMYSNNGIFVETSVRLDNFDNLCKFKNNYFLPIHYVVKYSDDASCVKDISANASKYNGYTSMGEEKTYVTLYRSYTDKKDENDKKWSTSKNMDGYVLTGKSEYR